MKIKNVIITGANGMIGGLILKKCLERKDVSKVTILVRNSLGLIHPKLEEVIHTDFMNYSVIGDKLANQDVCFFCIGVYTGKVSKPEFKRITVDVTRAFAEALKMHNENLTFCFLSGQGADSKEKSMIMFAREKGIAENLLLRIGFIPTYIFRPGYIYPVTPRNEPNTIYKMMRVLYKIFSPVFPDMGLTSEKLADTMVKVGMEGGKKVFYENKEIRLYQS